MAYFSNGTDGDLYREHWCGRCANNGDDRGDEGCAVWDAHFLYNGDQHKNKLVAELLSTLIPRGGLRNEQCRMFRERAK